MGVIGREENTTIINLRRDSKKIIIKNKTGEDPIKIKYLNEILSTECFITLRDTIKNNSKLLNKLVVISEKPKSYFLSPSDYENVLSDTKKLTIEKVGFLALYFRNQLLDGHFLKNILETNRTANFENWFKFYVEFNFVESLKTFFYDTAKSLSGLRKVTLIEHDIEMTWKKTFSYIEKTLLSSFKNFLKNDWEELVGEKLSDFIFKNEKINRTLVLSVEKD